MSKLNKKIDSFLEKANKAFVHPKKFKFLEHDKGLLVTHEESKLRIITGEYWLIIAKTNFHKYFMYIANNSYTRLMIIDSETTSRQILIFAI